MAAEKPTSKGQAWFCTTGLPSDVIIEVDDMTFHLHKFPLMSKSRKLHDLITEQEKNQTTTTNQNGQKFDNDTPQKDDEIEEEDEQQCHITLPDFPGGSESFETAAKFCYGVKIELTHTTAAPLRCAGEYLQMTEEYSEENLISKAERFLSHSVFKNIKHSLKTLTSCQKLVPMAENLGIVQRCIDAIASKSAATDPSLFGWPVNDGATVKISETDSWLNELGNLSLPLFQHLIFAMKSLNVSVETIETCLIHYAKKFFPGVSRTNRKQSSSSSSTLPSQNEQRELLETVISNLPTEKSSSSSSNNATRFLFGFLRASYILNASEGCRLTLEKRIGSQLEKASLDDLLIPSYSYLNETLYDVECVERILEFFLQGLEERSVSRSRNEGEDENSGVRSAALMAVGKLIDGYLSEIASDANLKPEKFYDLAIALPDHARLFDDGLYRAVDVYLKAHPWISEADREKICGILDCQKLTLEACTHAAQNERLPLRAVVQVLFFEQLQLRHAIAGTLIAAEPEATMEAAGRLSHGGTEEEEERSMVVARAPEGSSTWRAAVRENQVLRVDMDSMRTRVHELERECTTMRKAIEKIDKMDPKGHVEKGGWRNRFGCKFKTQVCDSHQPSVVEARRGRNNRHEQ